MKKILLITLFLISYVVSGQNLVFSEIMISPPGTDSPREFIELRGDPGATIASGTYFVKIEGDQNDPGDVETPANGGVIDLSGQVLGSNGYLLILTTGHPYAGIIDPRSTILLDATDGTLEDKSHTLLLITSPTTPDTNVDIDADDDGTPDGADYLSWTILDSIALLDDDDFDDGDPLTGPELGEFGYSNNVWCHCSIANAAEIHVPAGATIIYTDGNDFDYFARVGESSGSVISTDKSNTDWFAGDLSSVTDLTLENWKISGTTGKVFPNEYGNLEVDNLGSANHLIANTWEGDDSGSPNDWDTAANWSYNTVPVSTEFVSIPTGLTNYPTAAGAVTVKSLNITAGSTLIAQNTFIGEVKYSRNLVFNADNLKSWYLMSSPVTGETFNDSYVSGNLLASNATNRGVATYTTTSDSWSYLQDAGNGTFASGIGYSIKKGIASGNIYFKGSINSDNAGVDVVLNNVGNRFNLLGNPYTSYVNSVTFLTNEAAISETQELYVWDQTLGINGGYTTKNIASAFVIAPGQGFFVQANVAGGTFNFTEVNQAHNASDTFLKSPKTEIKLSISDGTIQNYAKIYYLNNASTGFDLGYDGRTFTGIPSEFEVFTELVSNNKGVSYQIQSLPNSGFETMSIPVGVKAGFGKEITFSAETLNLPSGLKVFLEDNELNTITNLNDGDYKITLKQNLNGTGRFFIHTSAKTVLSTESVDLTNSISIYKKGNNTLRIAGIEQGKASISIFNVLGKQVMTSILNADTNIDVQLPKLATGVYIVRLNTEKGTLNKKIILE